MTGAEFGGVDIDLLADYIGGALTGTPEESAVAARIAGEPAWREAYASLSDGMAFVSAELGRFEPEPMPADLVARLDAALAAAPVDADSAAGRTGFLDLVARGADVEPAELGSASSDGASGPVVPGGSSGAIADPEPIAPDLAQPPAPHLTLVGGGRAGGDVPNPVREKAPVAPRGRRLRWATPIAVAAGIIAFVGFGLDYLSGLSSQNDTSASTGAGNAKEADGQSLSGAAPTVAKLLATGTDYTRATLGDAPVQPKTAPFAASEGTPSTRQPAPAAAGGWSTALQRLAEPPALDQCLRAIERENADGAISVESVDYARFSGTPAVIVRFTSDNGRWAWASGDDCGTTAAGADTLGKVPVG